MTSSDHKPLSASALIFMAAVQRLGDAATGVRIASDTGANESAIYNIASRLSASKMVVSKRGAVGGFTRYTLTAKGAKALEHVRKALA